MMLRNLALGLAALPLAVSAVAPSAAAAQAASPLTQVQTHMRAVNTMTANFTQTDRRGRSLDGRLFMKRPGKVRFQYQQGVPLLVVSDGRALTMIDYQVKQVSRWPIGNSPLSVILNPDKKLDGIATVMSNTPQVLLVRARDPKRREYGTITMAFAKVPSAPGGLILQGWTMVDAQNNQTTVKLSNQRFNVAVADTNFRWTDPRRTGAKAS